MNFIEIFVVEGFGQFFRVFVEESAVAVELSVQPHAVVGWLVLSVVKNAFSVYFVVFELALVESSIVEEQSTCSMFVSVEEMAFIFVAIFVMNFAESGLFFRALLFLPAKLIGYFLNAVVLLKGMDRLGTGLNNFMFLVEFDILDRFEDAIAFGVQKAIFDGFLQGTLFQFIYIFQIFSDHLQKFRSSV